MPADLSASGEDRMRDVTFSSGGAELHAWLYEPNTPPPWPLVAMAHRANDDERGWRPNRAVGRQSQRRRRADEIEGPMVSDDQTRRPSALPPLTAYDPSAEFDYASSVQARFVSEAARQAELTEFTCPGRWP